MSPRAPLVSVALPVFNGGADLRLAIQSIVNQSFTDWELLLIDDGSTDGAIGAVDLSDPRIRLIRDGANRGLTARLNQAVDLARGEYVARMDADDISHSERFARQAAYLDTHPEVDLLGARCLVINGAERFTGMLPFAETHAEICAAPWRGFYMAHPTWMGRIGWFRRFRYADPGAYRCEDQQLLLKAHSESRYHALPDPLLAYRVRDRTRFATLLRTRLALFKVQSKFFAEKGELRNLMLASATFVARIALDSLLMGFSPAQAHARRKTSTLTPAQEHEWHVLMSAAHQEAKVDAK